MLKHLHSELLQGGYTALKGKQWVYSPCEEGVRHGKEYHDTNQPGQCVCLGRVPAAAVLLCPPASTRHDPPEDGPVSSHRQTARWTVGAPVWRQDGLTEHCHHSYRPGRAAGLWAHRLCGAVAPCPHLAGLSGGARRPM